MSAQIISAYRQGRITGHARRLGIASLRLSVDATRATAALRRLDAAITRTMERVYAREHGGKIPGSTRTARLRKKRHDAVLRWWREQ